LTTYKCAFQDCQTSSLVQPFHEKPIVLASPQIQKTKSKRMGATRSKQKDKNQKRGGNREKKRPSRKEKIPWEALMVVVYFTGSRPFLV